MSLYSLKGAFMDPHDTRYLNLATPTYPYPHYLSFPDDQIPSRVVAGMLPLDNIFECIDLIVTQEQMGGRGNPTGILRELEFGGARVLGPNIGEEMLRRQGAIPPHLQGKHMLFLGEMYRSPERGYLCARGLYWDPDGGGLHWDGEFFDPRRTRGAQINVERHIVVLRAGAPLVHPSA